LTQDDLIDARLIQDDFIQNGFIQDGFVQDGFIQDKLTSDKEADLGQIRSESASLSESPQEDGDESSGGSCVISLKQEVQTGSSSNPPVPYLAIKSNVTDSVERVI
jgi:hypothetical protein